MPGAVAPAVSCAGVFEKMHTSWSQVQPNTSGIPRAVLDDLYRALLGVPGVLVTVASDCVAGLTPASGCRDHTASSDTSARFVRAHRAVHRFPASRSRRLAERPSCRGGM